MDTVGDNDKRDVRRPMNAFLIFCKRHRSIVREKNPDLDNRSVTRILGDLWANLKDEEKVVYTDLAKQYKDAFMKANPDYKWHNPEKAVTCQKTGVQLSKPTNAKVMKSEMNLLTEGSIMPGKLADPCNMGGLSLLLMAGEQQSHLDNRDHMITSLSNHFPTSDSTKLSHTFSTSDSSRFSNTIRTTDMSRSSNIFTTTDSCKLGEKPDTSSDVTVNDQPTDTSLASHGTVKEKVDVQSDVQTDTLSGMVSDTKGISSNESMVDKVQRSDTERTLVDGRIQDNENVTFKSTVVTSPSLLLTDTALRKPLLYQAMTAPKLPTKSLLADTLKDYLDKGNNSDILKDNSVSTQMSNVENQSYIGENRNKSDKEAKVICKHDEKENISEKIVSDIVKEDKDDAQDDESPMVTCGKLVVNHIIDRLYSSELATAGRKTTESDKMGNNAAKDVKNVVRKVEAGLDFPVKLECGTKKDVNIDATKQSDTDKLETSETCKIKSETLLEFGVEHDEYGTNSNEGLDNDATLNKTSGKVRNFSSSGKCGEDSTENEDVEDYQPVRKSRRRNRGQRYQELINEGIIQLSKERMAALQQPTKKEESPDEDVESMEGYNSYILPETAIRRIRKRTTSESAKDKILSHDDMKRYKTGDFDLEAQIATLPACSVENMGRKRGFARQRHNSECIHTQRKLSDIDTFSSPHQVFNTEKIVTLPPHIKLMSDTTSQEPVVGSRKRKARKHSITHMVPAPATLIKNGKVKSDSDCLGPCLIKPEETPVNDQNQTMAGSGLHNAVAMETDQCDHSSCKDISEMQSDCDTETCNKSEPVKCDNATVLDCVQRQTGCEKCESSDTDSTQENGTQSGQNSVDQSEGAQMEADISVNQSVIDKLTMDINKSEMEIDQSEMKINQSEKEINQSEMKINQSGMEIDQSEMKINQSEKEINQSEMEINQTGTEINKSGDKLTMEISETQSTLDSKSEVEDKTEVLQVNLEQDVVTSASVQTGTEDCNKSIQKSGKDVNCNNTIKND